MYYAKFKGYKDKEDISSALEGSTAQQERQIGEQVIPLKE